MRIIINWLTPNKTPHNQIFNITEGIFGHSVGTEVLSHCLSHFFGSQTHIFRQCINNYFLRKLTEGYVWLSMLS